MQVRLTDLDVTTVGAHEDIALVEGLIALVFTVVVDGVDNDLGAGQSQRGTKRQRQVIGQAACR